MRFGSVCSGIEAASVAWHPLGWRAAWLSEIDAHASAVLAYRFPNVPNLGDMTGIATMIEARVVDAPDVLVGGTPCQGFSVAGRRGGLADPRGQLTLSYVEILDAIDDARREAGEPECIAVWENVPGVLSMGDNAFGNFLAALAGEDSALEPPGKRWPDAGIVVGPQRAIAWRVLDAQFFGLAQRRKRVFVVASARDGFDPGEILLEFDGVRRDSPPSRQAQQNPAASAQGRADVSGGKVAASSHWDGDEYPHPTLNQSNGGSGVVGYSNQELFSQRGAYLVPDAGPRLTNRLSSQPVGARMLGFGHYEIDETASTMKARDYKDATDLIINPIAFTAKDHGQDATEDLSPTLRAGGHTGSHANGGVMPAVAYERSVGFNWQNGGGYGNAEDGLAVTDEATGPIQVSQHPAVAYSMRTAQTGANGIGIDEHISPTLDVSGAPSVAYAIQERAICENPDAGPDGIGVREDVAYTLEARRTAQAVGHEVIPFDTTQITHPENRSNPQPGDPCHPLAAAGHPPSIISHMAVRRLMPVECERLQGFPDNWTRIPVKFFTTKQVSALRPDDMWEVGFGPNNRPGWWLMSSDSHRYKQCGNSMARNCMAWIGGRIRQWLQLEPFRELIG
jgi:DNA (cytosine-5)-methyltransferase 1